MLKNLACIVALLLASAVVDTQAVNPAGDSPATPEAHDDAPALQAQIAKIAEAGFGTLELQPWRVYHLNSALLARHVRGLRIVGNGATLQSLPTQPITGADGGASGELLRFVSCTRVRISDLSLDGNRQNRTGVPGGLCQGSIDIQACSDVDISGVTSSNAVQDDVTIWGAVSPTGVFSSDIRIHDNHFGGPAHLGMLAAGGPGRNGVSVVQGQHVVIRDNRFESVQKGWDGIDVESNPGDTPGTNSDIAITQNAFDHCYLGAMVNSQARPKNVVIVGNRIAFATYGIDCWAAESIIRANDLHDIATFGIGVFNGGSAVVDGNTVTICGGCGIYLDGPGHAARNNTLTTCATAAGQKAIMLGPTVNADWDRGGNVVR
jgi:polygalacturonase